MGPSLAVQRLGLHASAAGGAGAIPGRGAEILRASRHRQKKKLCWEKKMRVGVQFYEVDWKN